MQVLNTYFVRPNVYVTMCKYVYMCLPINAQTLKRMLELIEENASINK